MGLAIGIAMSGAGIGQLVMAPLMQLVLRNYGLKNSFMLIGAFITLCILPIYTIYRETSRHPIMSQNEKKKSIKKIYKEIFGSFDIILMLLLLGKQKAHSGFIWKLKTFENFTCKVTEDLQYFLTLNQNKHQQQICISYIPFNVFNRKHMVRSSMLAKLYDYQGQHAKNGYFRQYKVRNPLSPPLGVVVFAKIIFAYNSLKRKKRLLDSNKKMSK